MYAGTPVGRLVGLDYADQRYYAPGSGRFMTPDRTMGNPADPSSWNLYAYTRGDPINRVDPSGLDSCSAYDAIINDCTDPASSDPTWCIFNPNDPACWGSPPTFSQPILTPQQPSFSSQVYDVLSPLIDGGVVDWWSSDDDVNLTLHLAGVDDTVAIGFCAAQPEVCTIGGIAAAGYVIYVDWPQLQNVVKNVETLVNAPIVVLNVYRRRIGASGKPMRHFPRYPTRKRARDAARNNSKNAPEEHRAPKKGGPHFHGTDRNGEIIGDGVHYTFPRWWF
ncbi:MAG TPA: RHS repeat-associated core domain-containing protein [Bryobacteraceae bacterium]|nr:RHS repeat-associated core domain-containing protein [Bryobacteraceae bacterium]